MTVNVAYDVSAASSINSLPVAEVIQCKVGSSAKLLLLMKWVKAIGALCILLAEVGTCMVSDSMNH